MRTRITIARALTARPLVVVAMACLSASFARAQTATLTAGGSGSFGIGVSAGAQLSLTSDGCVGTDDDGPYYGTLSIYVGDYSNEIFVGIHSNGFQVSTGGPAIPGTYSVSGIYSGYSGTDGQGHSCDVAGASSSSTAVVPRGTSSTAVTAPSVSVQSGQTISLPVVITPQVGGYGPTGIVTLAYGTEALTSQTVTPTYNSQTYLYSGTATLSASTRDVPPGSYSLGVSYSGDSTYSSSSSAPFIIKVIASQQSTMTALAVAPNPVLTGESAAINIVVTPAGNVTPSGTVTILTDSKSIGEVTLNPSTGSATLSVPAHIAPGTYSVQALYGGDSFNLPSTSEPVSVTVATKTSTTTALIIIPTNLTQGQTAQLTATITPQIGNVAPTGSVNISANGETLASLPLKNGTASIQVSSASYPAGTYSVVANYLGNPTDEPSQSPTQSVTILRATSVVVTASPNPVTKGNVTTLTATVTSGSGQPVTSGTVAFSYSGNALGSATLNSSGVAQLPISTSGLTTGSYVIQAAFSGTSNSPAAAGMVTLRIQ